MAKEWAARRGAHHEELVQPPFVDAIPLAHYGHKVDFDVEQHLLVVVVEAKDDRTELVAELLLERPIALENGMGESVRLGGGGEWAPTWTTILSHIHMQ